MIYDSIKRWLGNSGWHLVMPDGRGYKCPQNNHPNNLLIQWELWIRFVVKMASLVIVMGVCVISCFNILLGELFSTPRLIRHYCADARGTIHYKTTTRRCLYALGFYNHIAVHKAMTNVIIMAYRVLVHTDFALECWSGLMYFEQRCNLLYNYGCVQIWWSSQ